MNHEKSHLCVCMLDVDYFKGFNDTNGHDAGDEVLKFIGALLKENFRGNDIACRFGGDEFLLVLVEADVYTAFPRMNIIREELKSAKLSSQGSSLPQVTISIGIAQAPDHGSTSREIIRAADRALYQAKQAGRDCVEIFDSSSN